MNLQKGKTMKRLLLTLLLISQVSFSGAEFDETLNLAKQGNVIAQHNLGIMYDRGEGVAQNDTEAVTWYRKAAMQGMEEAQVDLGVMYMRGQGVPVGNEVKALVAVL